MDDEFIAMDKCSEEAEWYSRHLCLRYNTARQLFSTRVVFGGNVNSKDNIVDPITEQLNRLIEMPLKGID